MAKLASFSENVSVLVTHHRFVLGYSNVNKKREQLYVDGLLDEEQYKKVKEEDVMLKIKYKTYKKCVRQLLVGLFMTAIGFTLLGATFLCYVFVAGGLILSMSSCYGLLFNRLTKIQKAYIKA